MPLRTGIFPYRLRPKREVGEALWRYIPDGLSFLAANVFPAGNIGPRLD